MMDIQRLKDALMGVKDQKADDSLGERLGSPEIPFSPVDAAANEMVNDKSQGPNTKTKEELIKDQVEQEAAKTVPGQMDKLDVPDKPKPKTQLEMIQEQMSQLRTDDDAKISEARDSDRNRMMLANAIKGLGTLGQAELQRKSGVSGGIDKFQAIKGQDTASALVKDRDSKLAELQNQLKMIQGKKDQNGKIFQTRSGLVQLGEDGKPVQIFKDPYMESGRKVKEESLDLRKDSFELTKELKGRLSDTEVESVNRFDDGVRILDDIDDLLKNTDVNTDLGPYASRAESAQQYIPGMEMDEPFVKTQQLVGIQLADYVKSISGAQVSEEEAQRLLKNIPNMSDKPVAFKTKLDQFRKDLKDSKDLYLDNIGVQKKGAKKFKDSKKPSEEYSTSQERGIENVMKNNNVSREQAIKALKKAKKL